MKVLITGSTGFIGKSLLKCFNEDQYQITLLSRREPKVKYKNCKIVLGDLHNHSALTEAIKDQDCVVHLAGAVKAKDQKAFDKVNVEGTQNLLDAAVQCNPNLKKFVLISSLAAAGPSESSAVEHARKESDANEPISLYGTSKDRSEKAFLDHEFAGQKIILRPPIVYGPGDYQLLDLFKLLSFGISLKMPGKEKYYSMVFVEDFCRAIVWALKSNIKETRSVFYVADSQIYSMQDIIDGFQSAAKIKKIRNVVLPKQFFKLLAVVSDAFGKIVSKPQPYNSDKYKEMCAEAWTCSSEKIKTMYGFECNVFLNEGLERAVQWYKKEGLLKL